MDKMIKRLLSSGHPKWVRLFKYSRKKFIMSIVSLVLAAVVLMTSTYCWFSLFIATGDANNISLAAGKGLRVNDIGQEFQNISDDSYLIPASSVDGRNLYFPADGTPYSNVTNQMLFRAANAGDMNKNYVQLNFQLTAEADYTSIYLDKRTSLKVKNSSTNSAAKKAEKALRSAIFYEGIEDNKPIVFSSQNKTVTTQALDEIDRTTGKYISRKKQVAVPFRDYTYGKRALATLNRGETRHFSLLIWLEGTDEVNCTSVPVMLKELELSLIFTTSWDNTEKITFKDMTEGSKIVDELSKPANAKYSLVLNYNNKAHNIVDYRFKMYKDGASDTNEWYCNIPGNAYNDLTFMIIDDTDKSIVYQWKQDKSGKLTYNRGTATVYYADTIDSEHTGEANVSAGHWYDGDIEDHGIGGDDGEIGGGW